MTTCVVIDINTNEQVNTIVAEPTDLPPLNCRLVELPEGHYWSSQANQTIHYTSYWNGTEVVPIPEGYYWDGSELQIIPTEVTDGS